jgi:hypothetical protein
MVIATGYMLDRRVRVRFRQGEKCFSLINIVQTSSGAESASYLAGIKGSFGGKVAEV